jgi:uncharacterized membrane protein YwzB
MQAEQEKQISYSEQSDLKVHVLILKLTFFKVKIKRAYSFRIKLLFVFTAISLNKQLYCHFLVYLDHNSVASDYWVWVCKYYPSPHPC